MTHTPPLADSPPVSQISRNYSFCMPPISILHSSYPSRPTIEILRSGQPWSGRTQIVIDLTGSVLVSAVVEKFDDFENAAGNRIGQPYLKLTKGATSILPMRFPATSGI